MKLSELLMLIKADLVPTNEEDFVADLERQLLRIADEERANILNANASGTPTERLDRMMAICGLQDVKPQNRVPEHLEGLKKAFADDSHFAWGWHCNVAMAIWDQGDVTRSTANKAAAQVMQRLFGVDTSKCEEACVCAAPSCSACGKIVEDCGCDVLHPQIPCTVHGHYTP